MPLKRISDLPAGTPPYSGASLLEVSVPTGATPPYASRKVAISDFVAPLYGDVGRNLVHNSLFNVAQRGAGPFTAPGYTLDRWGQNFSVSTSTTSLLALADADRTAIGEEAAQFAMQTVAGGTAGATDFAVVTHYVENVRRLSGKTVTLSFWAKANTGTPKLGLELFQSFGLGGSPSATVLSIGVQTFTLSTSWARYTSTPVAIPNTVGKVLGTAGGDMTGLDLWLSAGSSYAARAGTVGVQSYTLQLWGVQLEIGSAATPLEKPDPQQDLAKCQRFYQTGLQGLWGYNAAGQAYSYIQALPQTMRATPTTVIIGTPSLFNATGPSIAGNDTNHVYTSATTTALGSCVVNFSYTLSADL